MAVLRRNVSAVVRLGLLRFEGRRARCRCPSALLSLSPAPGRLPVLRHACQTCEVSVFAVEDFAVYADRPVAVQFAIVRVPAHAESEPPGTRELVRQHAHGEYHSFVVLLAERVRGATSRCCTEIVAEIACKWILYRCILASGTELCAVGDVVALRRVAELRWYGSPSVLSEPEAGMLERVWLRYRSGQRPGGQMLHWRCPWRLEIGAAG